MKLLVIFAAVLAVAVGYPAVSTWTINELSLAIQNPATDPAIIPYLEKALNQLMNGLILGEQQTSIVISLPVHATLTLDELTEAVHDPSTDPALLPYYENALHNLMVAIVNGQEEESITVDIPVMTVNEWTLQELSDALENPETDPELHIYLEHALNQLMAALFSGEQITSIAVVTPPGVVSVAPPPVVAPEPVLPPLPPGPILVVDPMPEPTPVAPEIVAEPETAPDAASPLVQLIVNINQAIRV